MLKIDYVKVVKMLSDVLVVPGTNLTVHDFNDSEYYHCHQQGAWDESPVEIAATTSKPYDVGDPFAYALPKKLVRIKIPFFKNDAKDLYKNPDIDATPYLSYDTRRFIDYYRVYHEIPIKDETSPFFGTKQEVAEDQVIWIMREGLVGEQTVAFEAHKYPGLFMAQYNLKVGHAKQYGLRLLPIENDDLKKWVSYDIKPAFKQIKGRKLVSFKSHTLLDYYLRIETTWSIDQMVCVTFINHELKQYHASFELEYIHGDGEIYDHAEEAIKSPEDRALPITLEGSSLDTNIVQYTIKTQPTHGILTGNPRSETYTYHTDDRLKDFYTHHHSKKTYTYAPYEHYHGADSFTYTVTDAQGRESYPVTVSINVTAVNDEPVAHDLPRKNDRLQAFAFDDHYLHHDDAAMKVDTLDNASPLIKNPLTEHSKWLTRTLFTGSGTVSFESLSKPGHFIQVVDNGLELTTLDSWQAKKNAAFFKRKGLAGDDTNSFESYTHPNQYIQLDPALKSLRLSSIESDEDKKHASFFMSSHTSQAYRLAEDEPLAITLSGADAEDKITAYKIVRRPANGSLTGVGGADYSYTPKKGFSGEDSFTYKVINDSNEESELASVRIDVFANKKPVANSQNLSFGENSDIVITLSGEDSDGDVVSYDISTPPKHGLVRRDGATVTYIPNKNNPGFDNFGFVVIDNKGVASEPAVVTLRFNKQIALEESETFNGGASGFFQLIILLGIALFYRCKPGSVFFIPTVFRR